MFGWFQKRWERARSWIRSTFGPNPSRQRRAERELTQPLTRENGNHVRTSSIVDQKRLSALEANDAERTIAESAPLQAPSADQGLEPSNTANEHINTKDIIKPNDDEPAQDIGRITDGVNHTGERIHEVGNATDRQPADGDATLTEQKVVSGLESVPEGESTSFVPVASNAPTGMTAANGSAALELAAPARSPRKRAVLIGIHYTQHVTDWPTLDTPGDDVRKMEAFLKARQYTEIRILLDEPSYIQPTADAVKDALRWLVEDAQEGDKLFLHYAGHGDQVKSDTLSEADGMDEAIVPLCIQGDETYITDNELHELLVKPVPGGCSLVSVFDCCHAGTMLDLPQEYPPSFAKRLVNTLPFLKKSSTLRSQSVIRRLTLHDPAFAQKDYELREETEAQMKDEISKRKSVTDKERKKRAVKPKGIRRASVAPSRQRTSNLLKLPETKMDDANGIPATQYGGTPIRRTQTPRSTIDLSQPTSPAQRAAGARISFEHPAPLSKAPTYGSMKSASSYKRHIDKWLAGSPHTENITSPIDDETTPPQATFVPSGPPVILKPQPDPRHCESRTASDFVARALTLHTFTPSDHVEDPMTELKPDVTSVAACLDSEEAIEKTDLGGMLTNVFIKCFEDRSKEYGDSITLGELREYLRVNFEQHTASLHVDCAPSTPGMTRCSDPNCGLPIIPPDPQVTSTNHLNREKVISI